MAETPPVVRGGISGRHPAHFAARNGHTSVLGWLLAAGAPADPRASDSVSPLQLAVWQNQLETAKLLVGRHGVDPKQLNDFDCGLQHWIGLSPPARAGDAGVDLLPLACWLRDDCGLDFGLAQRQGHTPYASPLL